MEETGLPEVTVGDGEGQEAGEGREEDAQRPEEAGSDAGKIERVQFPGLAVHSFFQKVISVLDSLPEEGVDKCGHGPGHVAGDGEVTGEGHLHLGGLDVDVDDPLGSLGRDQGIQGHVPELVVPERGDREQEIPRQHRAHAQIQEQNSERENKFTSCISCTRTSI